jgi:glycosyltransferase involved in cell wall biosynthesis
LALDTVFNKEMLNNDSFGIYFDKNENAVRQQINYVDQHPKQIKKLSENSHLGITDKYNWDCITDQYLDVFRRLANRKK